LRAAAVAGWAAWVEQRTPVAAVAACRGRGSRSERRRHGRVPGRGFNLLADALADASLQPTPQPICHRPRPPVVLQGVLVATGSMIVGRSGYTATLLPSGDGAFRGRNPRQPNILASAELYDPATGTFTATGSMNSARDLHTATLLPNGKVLIAGGSSGGSMGLANSSFYDPVTGTFAAAGRHDRGTVRPYGDAVAKRKGAHCRWTELQQCGAIRPKRRGIRTDGQHDPGAGRPHGDVVAKRQRCSLPGTGTPDMSAGTVRPSGRRRLRLRAP